MKTLNVHVALKQREADGVFSYLLRPAAGESLPPFTAGAHIDVHVAPSVVRQYSLCNSPAERSQYRIAVLREPDSRGGSAGMHDEVREGQQLKISEPRNHFPLIPTGRALLFAGGIGITPLLAMAYELHTLGTPFELHYCCRSSDRMAFRDELANAPFAASVQVYLDDSTGTARFNASTVLTSPQPNTEVYVCGPKGFIDHILDTARRNHWPEEKLHREYFGAAPVNQEGDESFDVELASTGKRAPVPADQSVLEVLLALGVDVPYSCESGVCGTCLTRVLAGKPDHRDSFLTDQERAQDTQFLPCCSRSKTPLLILDL